MSEKLYYIQRNNSYAGNYILWWVKDARGYTTNLENAEVFTEKDAKELHSEEDGGKYTMWLKSYIDKKVSTGVDMQNISKEGEEADDE